MDLAQLSRFLAHPSHDAGRADQRRAKQIAQRKRGAIFGDQLLDVEIDRRRLDALAILGRRNDAFGKHRSRFTATVRATMDRRAVFGHLDHALGKIEHLPHFSADHRTRVKPSATMAADGGGVLDDPIRVGDLAKRIAPVALLTAARFARARAQAAQNARLLLQSVARRRFRTVGAVQPQPPPKLGVLRPKRFDLALQRGNKLFDFKRKTHSTLESENVRDVAPNPSVSTVFHPPVTLRTHSGLGVTNASRRLHNSHACDQGRRAERATRRPERRNEKIVRIVSACVRRCFLAVSNRVARSRGNSRLAR